jgi:hypothetical protein
MENVRIDKGIKRGPKNKRLSVPRRRNPETGTVQGIPADLNPKVVLEEYLEAQTTSQIAKKYGVKRKTLVQWLRAAMPNEWKQVQLVRAEIRKEDGNDQIEVARDALALARAREMIKSAQWDLERMDATTYGLQTKVTVEHTGDLGDRLMRAEQRAIPGEYTQVVTDPSQSCDKSLIDKDSNKPA